MGKSFDFDGVVIGAGIAGFVAAVTLNGLGKKVALVEKRKLGGNCTSFTCLPSKALIRSGTVGGLAAHLDEVGLCASVPITIATDGVMSRVRSAVQRAQEKDLPETFEQIGIRVLAGTATFIDRHHVSVDGRTVSARFFIIASGTVPFIPPIEGLNQIPYYTNETIFTID
ncbi:MAG TPA: FAD-dependent oxidoreductase, partial [Thermodesulfobacteriota bacterium]|nr:FAD-dependent oxidoreductase [Thermodesulfobacteriota bacterium]